MAARLWDKGGKVNETILNFTVGRDPETDLQIVGPDSLASAAHAQMLKKVGVLGDGECQALLGVLKEIFWLSANGQFLIPRELEDCHTAIEAYLVERLGDVGKKVHTGRSRNDQVLVAMRIYLRQAVISALEQIAELVEVLLERAEKDREIEMPGYTHLQQAMPSSVGMWLHSFADSFIEEIDNGLSLLASLNCNPLGAASGFGVPIELDRDYTASLLGFSRVQWNPIEAQNSRGRYELKTVRWMSDVSSLIEKLAWDFLLYSTSEFGFVSLPRELTTGSSIMPQKRNPDVVELLRARASRIRGRASELEWVVAKLPSNYHRDFQYTKEPVFAVVADMSESLGALVLVVDSFSLNKDRLGSALTPEIYATYDAYLQVSEGIAFRDAYQQTAKRVEEQSLDVGRLRQEFQKINHSLLNWILDSRQRFTDEQLRIKAWREVNQKVESIVFAPEVS